MRKKNPPADNKLLPPAPVSDPQQGFMNVYLWGTGLEAHVGKLAGLVQAVQGQVGILEAALKKVTTGTGGVAGGAGGGGASGGIGTANIITGTHALRLGANTPPISGVGSMFYETDRHVLYVVTSPPVQWVFAAGIYLAPAADRPADLGPADVGFMFLDTDDDGLFVWDGSAWIEISVDVESAGYWSPVTNGDGDAPELIFDSFGNCVVAWTPTP